MLTTGETRKQQWSCPDWSTRMSGAVAVGLLTALMFRDHLQLIIRRSLDTPQYFHCLIIPFVSAALALKVGTRTERGKTRWCIWGLPVAAAGLLLHWLGRRLTAEILSDIAFLICINGCVLLIRGPRFFHRVLPAGLYLIFMLPLPLSLEHLFQSSIQLLGARETAWYLQTCGIPAHAIDGQILMTRSVLNAREIFSGLRLLLPFMALTSAVAILSRREVWERMVILWSGVPLAAVCGVIQLTAEGIAMQTLDAELLSGFRTISGLVILPICGMMLFGSLKLFDWLFVETEPQSPAVCISSRLPRAVRGAAS